MALGIIPDEGENTTGTTRGEGHDCSNTEPHGEKGTTEPHGQKGAV